MEMMGVIVYVVEIGICIFKDVVDAVFGVWMNDFEVFYVLGFVVGFYFYFIIVYEF